MNGVTTTGIFHTVSEVEDRVGGIASPAKSAFGKKKVKKLKFGYLADDISVTLNPYGTYLDVVWHTTTTQ